MTMRVLEALPLSRDALLAQIRSTRRWDAVIIGGGATGLGIAVDAAARGLCVVLIEQRDFASGTSSRSTKLIHGGVRYLAQGNIPLVREALSERAVLRRIAPALVHPLEFVVPCYGAGQQLVLRAGLGVYDFLAGRESLGMTSWLTRAETIQRLPGIRERGLRGGVSYWDAQFDDAAMAIALMQSACALGAVAVNYMACDGLVTSSGRIEAVRARDVETGECFHLATGCVFNAAGVWVDAIRALAIPSARRVIAISQGSHVVIDRRFMPADAAMLIPRTQDRRVLFALPWYGALLVGTTDVPRTDAPIDPAPHRSEIAFLLRTLAEYLSASPAEKDVRAAFSGLRPLFAPTEISNTARVSREHALLIESGNLVSVVGGKWTTYRRMAEDAVDAALRAGVLPQAPASRTRDIGLVAPRFVARDAADFRRQTEDLQFLDWARNYAQARVEEDVRARRTRLDFLDASSTSEASTRGAR